MSNTVAANLIAVDIGNSRMKIGRFWSRGDDRPIGANELPLPIATFDLAIDHATGEFEVNRLNAWCEENVHGTGTWLLASVHRAAADRLADLVMDWGLIGRVECTVRRLTYRDVPLAIRVDEPARLGIDRLLAALAANRIRARDRAAIVVDLGTAITVDLVDASGTFCGGAILPGIALSARALEEHTDALPRVTMDQLEKPPTPIGTSTVPAIESGLYWGAIGAVRELISQMSSGLAAAPEVFLTGGASTHVAELLARDADYSVRHVPHLVLSGIALVEP
ncbi:MAG: type III pantothenate kinase [Planctomycetes bacterium]|nr:type III pantothenate kinase [Planctomycetota bacterium]